jgi:hypothetical protein
MPRASYVLEVADEAERLRELGTPQPLLAAFRNTFSRPFSGSDSDWIIRLAVRDELKDRKKVVA